MNMVWNVAKAAVSFFMVAGLVFSSGVFSVLLYGKITGKQWAISYKYADAAPYAAASPASLASAGSDPKPMPSSTPAPYVKPASAMLDAPVFRQYPELPSGCEITSLSMLLHYAGIPKSKMDLLPDLKRDATPMKLDARGGIVYWGNPNDGFVGDITGKSRGFGIYHEALFELLHKYMPKGFDMTRSSFDRLEEQIARGKPVIVWTTVDFQEPSEWVVWDTPSGPIQTTFMEHAVLLVGYDEDHVYVNDPWTGKAQVAVDKPQFVQSWKAMGQQALSYNDE